MTQALDIRELVGSLALIESEGVAFYLSLAKHTENEKIKKLAVTMAKVEKTHQRRFEKLHDNLAAEAEPLDETTAEVREYIHALIDRRIFDTPEQAARLAANITDENEAVDVAINFEKENILLLIECVAVLTGDEQEMVKMFVKQEKEHIRSLVRIRQQLQG